MRDDIALSGEHPFVVTIKADHPEATVTALYFDCGAQIGVMYCRDNHKAASRIRLSEFGDPFDPENATKAAAAAYDQARSLWASSRNPARKP